MKKICVMLSTYNGEKFLEKQLASLLSQKCRYQIDIVIRDDGSKDNTVTVLKRWVNKYPSIKLLNDQKKLGPARSFYNLLKQCSGYDYYSFSDQDDIWDSDKLEIAIENIEKCNYLNDPILYCCNSRKIDFKGQEVIQRTTCETPKFNGCSLMVAGFAQGCSMVFTNLVREEMLNFSSDIFPMHDLAALTCTYFSGKIIYDNVPHFSHRVHGNNVDAITYNKNIFVRTSNAIGKWKKRSRNSPLNLCARNLLEKYSTNMNKDEKIFYKSLSNYKNNLKDKLYLFKFIQNNKFNSTSSNRSFGIRILLNLL